MPIPPIPRSCPPTLGNEGSQLGIGIFDWEDELDIRNISGYYFTCASCWKNSPGTGVSKSFSPGGNAGGSVCTWLVRVLESWLQCDSVTVFPALQPYGHDFGVLANAKAVRIMLCSKPLHKGNPRPPKTWQNAGIALWAFLSMLGSALRLDEKKFWLLCRFSVWHSRFMLTSRSRRGC